MLQLELCRVSTTISTIKSLCPASAMESELWKQLTEQLAEKKNLQRIRLFEGMKRENSSLNRNKPESEGTTQRLHLSHPSPALERKTHKGRFLLLDCQKSLANIGDGVWLSGLEYPVEINDSSSLHRPGSGSLSGGLGGTDVERRKCVHVRRLLTSSEMLRQPWN